MPGRFENKTIIITGAAGGIGRAAAVRFASEGANVVAVDLKGSGLDDIAGEVEKAGGRALTVAADVTRSSEVENYVARAKAVFGGVDFFFNNAGIEGWVGPSTEYPEEIFDRVIAVNLKGVWLGMKHVVPAMRERGGGAIVNTASVAACGRRRRSSPTGRASTRSWG